MITKFEQYIKEGVIDLMTPKSGEEVRQAYVNLVNSLKNCAVDKFPDKVQTEFEQIAKLFDVPKNNLYLISEESDANSYGILEEYFEDLVDRNNKVIIHGVKDEDGNEDGEWICYPAQKLARWSSNDFDNPGAWIFPENFFKDKLYESIRDKMTPISKDEVLKNLKHMNPVQYHLHKKDLDYDIPQDSEPLIYQIWKDMKKRFPLQTGKLHMRDLGSFGRNMEFNSTIDHRKIYVSHDEIMGKVMFKIYPFKKIRKLKRLISANNYMLSNIEEYNEMIEELVNDEKPLDRIKKFFSFNESIRDMMTPKSREEIISSLKGDRSVVFKTTNNPKYGMSGEIGQIEASYKDLVELFGEPNGGTDEYKVSTAWDLTDNLGRYVGIEDWKQTNLYDEDYPSVEEFRNQSSYNWIISGEHNKGKEVLEDLRTYIMLRII